MKRNLRTIITMMTTMVSACIIFASCGKVEETHNQVANTTEKAAAGATVESKEEIITKETTTTATTPETTTTTASTTEEPKTIAETTTEGVTIIVPDTDTETADTTVETNTDTEATEAVTTTVEPDTTTEATTAEADDGMYTIEECIRRVIRENMGQEVVSFEEAEENKYKGLMYYAYTDEDETVLISCPMRDIKSDFNEGVKTSLDRFLFGEGEIEGVTYKEIYYAPKND